MSTCDMSLLSTWSYVVVVGLETGSCTLYHPVNVTRSILLKINYNLECCLCVLEPRFHVHLLLLLLLADAGTEFSDSHDDDDM